MKFYLFFILALTIISCETMEKSVSDEFPEVVPEERNSPSDVFFRNFEADFREKLQATGCPGAAVVVVKDSSILYMNGFGVKTAYTDDSVDVNTVFRLGSLSKGFAGILAGKLVEDGYFNWDDPVVQTVPDFRLKDTLHTQRLTIKHLLSHSTGLARHAYTNLTESGMKLPDILPFFGNLPVYGREGEYFGYQNAAFSLIEEVVKQETGREFGDLLSSEILEPAGMINTFTTYDQLMAYSNLAQPHARNYRTLKFQPVRISDKYFNAVSAGGVNASISDMGNWLKVLLGHRPEVVSEETLDYVFSPLVKTSHKKRYYDRWEGVKDSYYGIGWRVLDYGDRMLIYHGGYVNYFASQIAIDRESGIGICVLFNAPNSYTSKVIPEFFSEYRLFDELIRLGAKPKITY